MKFFKRESFIKKVIIAIVIVLLTNFSFPTMSRANDLTEAIADFLLVIPDGLMWMMQKIFLGEGDVNIKVHSDNQDEETGLWGWLAIGATSAIPGLGTAVLIGNGIWNFFHDDGDFNLPNIKFTPYAIFHNDIPILNANFFSKGKNEEKTYYYFPGAYYMNATIPPTTASSEEAIKSYIDSYVNESNGNISDSEAILDMWNEYITDYYAGNIAKQDINARFKAWVDAGVISLTDSYKDGNKDFAGMLDKDDVKNNWNNGISAVDMFGNTNVNPIKAENYDQIQENYRGKSIDSGTKDALYSKITTQTTTITSSVSVLKPIISKWYNILRTVAMVGLLSVLVYIGIRILIYSASAQDKAKYKTMLKDWLVGLCLLFVLHFIMSFTMTVVNYICDIFGGNELEYMQLEIPKDTKCEESDEISKIDFDEHRVVGSDGKVYWKANIVERIRFDITSTDNNDEALSLRIAYIIMYIVIVIEVLIFTYQYLKRVITMAMLTLIAPLVALTYPIDKITDGKAQGFNMWLKEYIFNALLQPMHLILYTVIMSSAFALVESNPIYGIVALGCMTPMEKLLRKIFGFGKAESVGAFGGAAGAAVVMSTIGSLQKLGKKAPMGKGKEKDDGLKLWDNKNSIDSEGILLGAPEGGMATNDSGESNREELNQPENQNMSNRERVNNRTNAMFNPLYGGTRNSSQADQATTSVQSDTSQANQIPTSVQSNTSQTNQIPTNARLNTSRSASLNATQPTRIRSMPTTANRTSVPKRAIKSPRLYALGQVGKSYGKKLTRNLSVGNVARNVAKVATGAAVGGALGTVGLAAGIASGDLGKAVQYTTTAGVAGATLGSSFADKRANSMENIKDTYQTAYASADEAYAKNKRIKEFMKNEQNMQYLESRYVDKQERDEVINTMKQAAEYGITNVQDVSAIHEMKKQVGLDMNQAIAVAKMSKKMGDISQPKARKDWKEHFESKGYSDEQVKQVLNRVEKYQKERD